MGTVSITGHYYAYIDVDGQWYKFDDETVTPVDSMEAVERQFGEFMMAV